MICHHLVDDKSDIGARFVTLVTKRAVVTKRAATGRINIGASKGPIVFDRPPVRFIMTGENSMFQSRTVSKKGH